MVSTVQAARLASGGLRLYGTAICRRLTISRNLANVNGDTIEVESVEAQGSRFTVMHPNRGAA